MIADLRVFCRDVFNGIRCSSAIFRQCELSAPVLKWCDFYDSVGMRETDCHLFRESSYERIAGNNRLIVSFSMAETK